MKNVRKLAWLSLISLLAAGGAARAASYRVFGYVIDGGTQQGLVNVNVQLYYDPLASGTNDDMILVGTNTDGNGNYSFDALPGELEGQVRVLQSPTGALEKGAGV